MALNELQFSQSLSAALFLVLTSPYCTAFALLSLLMNTMALTTFLSLREALPLVEVRVGESDLSSNSNFCNFSVND